AKSSLEPQPATLEIDAPIVIFGDIHGQLRDLLRFFTIVGPPPQNKILFLGDYVDRCKKSFEVIMLLLCYRIKFPHLIHLLRGNHECSKMNRLYGFYEELRRKRCVFMWKKFQEVFNEMPLCAVVSSRLLCMHGGISPEIQNWDSLTRATSYIFGGDTIANICDMLDISMVVRAHEVVRVMKVSRRLEISFVTLKPRLDTNRLTEEKRLLLEKLAADAMAKSPDPCSRQPKEKAATNNDDCLIGPTAPPDTKGSEMQQRKTQLLSLMDAFETPSGAKTAAATKSAPAPGSTAVAQVAAKKRDTTPAPPVSTAGAPATTTKPPLAGAPKFTSDKHR
ncbi:Ser/Thr phosphatase family protein, partial [Ostertagia ostertagi]